VETEEKAEPVEATLPRWAPWLLGAVGIIGVVVMILLVR
jgi:hypothetical protein